MCVYFTGTIWSNLNDVKNDEIKELALSLPEVVMSARAATTTKKYEHGWSKWLEWCKDKDEVNSVPANPFFVATYINCVLRNANNKGALVAAFYGIRWGHHINGVESPTDHPFVCMTFDGAVRLCEKKPKTPKDPISPEIIKFLFEQFSSDSLINLRFLVMCTLGFFGFFRIDELLTVRLNCVNITTTHLEVFLEKSKNDQQRDGKTIYISRLDSQFCPVKLLEDFLTRANIRIDDHQETFLIPRLVKVKDGQKVHKSSGISYSRARDIFKENIEAMSIEGNFGLHSFRAGGASAAAENQVDKRLISKHGRWKSEKARDGYIKDSVKTRLKISQNLGI